MSMLLADNLPILFTSFALKLIGKPIQSLICQYSCCLSKSFDVIGIISLSVRPKPLTYHNTFFYRCFSGKRHAGLYWIKLLDADSRLRRLLSECELQTCTRVLVLPYPSSLASATSIQRDASVEEENIHAHAGGQGRPSGALRTCR
jgi:hypothetical protein